MLWPAALHPRKRLVRDEPERKGEVVSFDSCLRLLLFRMELRSRSVRIAWRMRIDFAVSLFTQHLKSGSAKFVK